MVEMYRQRKGISSCGLWDRSQYSRDHIQTSDTQRREQAAMRLNLEGLAVEEERLSYNAMVSNKFSALNLLEDERDPEE